MILVTGAAGKTGKAVVRALVAAGKAVRALVHRPEQIQTLAELGAAEALAGDMRVPGVLDQACRGVQGVYHICPNMSPDELAIGQAAILAARANQVEQFVYHSVHHPQTEAMPHHWLKLRVEERLFESGLPFTVLQPAPYMQNVLAHWDQIQAQGQYPVPYAAEARLSLVDLTDVALAAAAVLSEPGHAGATYELAGTEGLSQTEVAAILSERLQHPIRVQVTPRGAWAQRARAAGLGEYQIETLLKMFCYYESYGLWGSPKVLGWLLRRPPTTFAAFVERTAQERQDGSQP